MSEENFSYIKYLERYLEEYGVCKVVSPNSQTDTLAQYWTKIKEIEWVLNNDFYACEAKWNFFVTAANSDYCNDTVKLYLPEFIHSIEHLLDIICETPSLSIMHAYVEEFDYFAFKKEVIQLLHYVLIGSNSPQLEIIEEESFLELLARIQDENHVKPPTYIFKVHYADDDKENQVFEMISTAYGAHGAFYSCNPSEVYNLLCDGFQSYKKPINLTNKITIALSETRRTPCWGKSCYGHIMRTVGLVDYVSRNDYITHIHDMETSTHDIYVQLPRLVRLRYLLLYMEQLPPEKVEKAPIMETVDSDILPSVLYVLVFVGVVSFMCRSTWKHACMLVGKKIFGF